MSRNKAHTRQLARRALCLMALRTMIVIALFADGQLIVPRQQLNEASFSLAINAGVIVFGLLWSTVLPVVYRLTPHHTHHHDHS